MSKILFRTLGVFFVIMGLFWGLTFASNPHCESSNYKDNCNISDGGLPFGCRHDPVDNKATQVVDESKCWYIGCEYTIQSNDAWYTNDFFKETANTTIKENFTNVYGDYGSIRELQEKMNDIRYLYNTQRAYQSILKGSGCDTYVCEDGRLGKNTINAMTSCWPCGDDTNFVSLNINNGDIICATGYEANGDLESRTNSNCCIKEECPTGGSDDDNDNCTVGSSTSTKPDNGNSSINCEHIKSSCEENDGYKVDESSGICRCVADCDSDIAKENCLCGIKLNTIVPFIGDCIQMGGSSKNSNTTVVTPNTAFPLLMSGLSKIVVTAILVFSFLLLVVAGVMMTTGGADEGNYSKGKELIGKVIIGIALVGASGIILKLINPSFFG